MILLSQISVGWRVFFLAMLPVTELRAALPMGVVWGLPVEEAFLWTIAGNFLPVIPLLLFLRWLYGVLLRSGRFPRLLHKLQSYQEAKGDKVRRYGMIGLTFLVAVPLPGTGVWTGAVVASVLGLDLLPAIAAITLGEILAGILVGIAVSGVSAAMTIGPEAVLLLLIAGLILYLLFRKKKN